MLDLYTLCIIVLFTAVLFFTTSAFVVVPGSRSSVVPPSVIITTTATNGRRPTIMTSTMKSSLVISSSLSSSSYNEAILEDSDGHINGELARRIWKWEKQQRLNLDLPDFQKYSTRTGLRWVRESVLQTMSSSTTISTTGAISRSGATTTTTTTSKRDAYDDLIQEGVIALMVAAQTFERKSNPNESFETFAKNKISLALDSFTLERAKGSGTTGTIDKIYPPLSVESTVDIVDPFEPDNHCYYNQDEWEIREGFLHDNGQSLNENLQYEGEDQTQSIAASLRDSIPEIKDDRAFSIINDIMGGTGNNNNNNSIRSAVTSPADAALADMILYNVDGFFGKSLDETESHIIQMRYGLDEDDEQKSLQDISYDLNLTISKVRKIQKVALRKLRANFTKRYITDDTGHEEYWEDTV